MEKTRAAAMLPPDVGGRGVGSWSSLWEVVPHDEQGMPSKATSCSIIACRTRRSRRAVSCRLSLIEEPKSPSALAHCWLAVYPNAEARHRISGSDVGWRSTHLYFRRETAAPIVCEGRNSSRIASAT